jgi:Tfp pilus assembly protein PilO
MNRVEGVLNNQLARCARTQWMLAAGTLLVCAGIYALGIRPANAQLAKMDARFNAAQAILNGNQAQARNLPEIEKEIERLRQRVERFDKKMPKGQDLAEFIKEVTRISRQSSLQKLVWRPEVKLRRSDAFAELPIEFTFSGDFAGVSDFLRRIDQMPRLTRVRKLEMRAGHPGWVDVRLTMNLYFAEE